MSRTSNVTSGIILEPLLGPLFNIFINPLLKKTRLPIHCFTNDTKFIADVNEHIIKLLYSQRWPDVVLNWSDEHLALLSVEKKNLQYCTVDVNYNQIITIFMHGAAIKSADHLTDLEVIRSLDGSYKAHYLGLITKARKAVGLKYRASHLKYRASHLRTQQLMKPAFQVYVIPILMFGSSAWSPHLLN